MKYHQLQRSLVSLIERYAEHFGEVEATRRRVAVATCRGHDEKVAEMSQQRDVSSNLKSAAKHTSVCRAVFMISTCSSCVAQTTEVDSCFEVVDTAAELTALKSMPIEVCGFAISESNLSDIDELRGLQPERPATDGWLSVSLLKNPVLDDITGLEESSIEQLIVYDTRLAGAQTLPPRFDHAELHNIESTSLLWRGENVDDGLLVVERSANLTSINIDNHRSLAQLWLVDLPQFTNIATAFPNLTAVKKLRIARCPHVTAADIDALSSLLPDGVVAEHCGNADDEPCEETD